MSTSATSPATRGAAMEPSARQPTATAKSTLRWPAVLRLLVYVFVLSIFFQSFTFSFLRASDTVTWLLGVLLLAAFAITAMVRGGRVGISGKDVKWYLLFLLVILLEEAVRPDPTFPITKSLSLRNLFSYVQVLAMYFVVRSITRDWRAYRGILTTYLVALVLFSAPIILGFGFVLQSTDTGRMGITGQNLNSQAFVFSAGTLCIISLLLNQWPRTLGRKHIILGAAGLSMLVALVRTGSRGGAVAFVAGMAVILFLNFRSRKRSGYFLLAPLVLLVIAYVMGSSPVLRTRFESTLTEGDYGSRVELSTRGREMFIEKPLLGWGAAYPHALGRSLGKIKIAAHNTYLQFLDSFGLVGTFFIVVAIFLTFKRAWRQRGSPWGAMLIAIMGMTAAFAAVSNLAYDKHFWVLLALVANVDVMAGKAIHRGPVRAPGRPAPIPRS